MPRLLHHISARYLSASEMGRNLTKTGGKRVFEVFHNALL